MESLYVKTDDETYLKMAKFWGKLFLINFALGVVTGITMEFQFGMNWAEYSKYVGDIFGAPLAIEATTAFFLESTFIGLWIFGWNKISKKAHARAIWIVAIATNLSALWILLANGWMQNPVGYILNNGRAEMTDFYAVATNEYGWIKFIHTVSSGYVLAAFFVMGISAYHLLKGNQTDFFKRSLKIASTFGIVSCLVLVLSGDFHAVGVAKAQPTKFAAMEAVWDTQKNVPYNLFVLPDTDNEKNSVSAVGLPGMLSWLAFHDSSAEIKGLKTFPLDERPPVMATFLSFRSMAALGALMGLVLLWSYFATRKSDFEKNSTLMRVLLYSIPLPYIAIQLGWIVAEVGRQPWIVYGVLKTKDGVSKAIDPAQVIISLIGFTVIYGVLAVVDAYLITKNAKRGPEEDVSAFAGK